MYNSQLLGGATLIANYFVPTLSIILQDALIYSFGREFTLPLSLGCSSFL